MLKLGKLIFSAIVYSNLWISIGGTIYTWFSASILSIDLPWQFFGFIFSATLFTYNFQRLIKLYSKKVAQISGPRAEWVKNNLSIVYLMTFLSALSGLYFGWSFLLESYWLLILAGFFSLFYVLKLPILNVNLRSIPNIKIYILGITWVLVTQILPFMLFSTLPITLSVWLFFLGSFLFIFSISIPFDIRDLKVDNQSMKTIPQVLGIKNAKRLAVVSIVLSGALFLLVVKDYQIGILLNTVLTVIVISKSGKYKNELAYSGMIDGMFICISLLWYIFE